ncbi:MAG: DUF192 domain-containing protein [Actinomycetota bacterium]|nr:DUF192 domain-containing protein [Actinomycetota bacterium]
MRRLLILTVLVGACSSTVPSDLFESAEIRVGTTDLNVWIADESAERRRGLMEIEVLPSGIDGMVFSWSSPVSARFHMENTLMPLDIWWFDADGVLIGRTEMVPCETEDCPTYRPPGPVLSALETPAGVETFPSGAVLSTVEND